MEKKRDSNMELLRIVSMVLVLITHACYVSLGPPTQADITASYSSSIMRSLSESLSDVGVNTFILISGWFGIRSRLSRFVEFIFQIYFLEVLLYAMMKVLGLTGTIGIDGWIELFFFRYGTYWFIKAYIVLYIFAPLLNAFVENCSRKQLQFFLISFYIVQTIYGFYINIGWFSNGYSPMSFMGLYLLARYMRLYPSWFAKFDKSVDVTLYFLVSLITALCSLSMTYFFGKVGTVLFQNSCPLMIISSVYFFLFFTKISFQNNYVNWVSASCFAAYLVHCSPFIFYPYYINIIKCWFEKESIAPFLLYTSGLIAFFFIFSILFDKVRIMVWKFLCGLCSQIKQ
jgi:hypothetical protein